MPFRQGLEKFYLLSDFTWYQPVLRKVPFLSLRKFLLAKYYRFTVLVPLIEQIANLFSNILVRRAHVLIVM